MGGSALGKPEQVPGIFPSYAVPQTRTWDCENALPFFTLHDMSYRQQDPDFDDEQPIEAFEGLCSHVLADMQEDNLEGLPADATPTEALIYAKISHVERMVQQTTNCIINLTDASAILIKLYVCMFYCNYGAINGKGHGPLLAKWIGEQITKKLSGKLMLTLHQFIQAKCTIMVHLPSSNFVYPRPCCLTSYFQLRSMRQDMNRFLTEHIAHDFRESGSDLMRYKAVLLKDKARQRMFVVKAIRACPKSNELQSDNGVWMKQFAHSDASLEWWQEQIIAGCTSREHFLFKALEGVYLTVPVCMHITSSK
jgi:hypothetical protein